MIPSYNNNQINELKLRLFKREKLRENDYHFLMSLLDGTVHTVTTTEKYGQRCMDCLEPLFTHGKENFIK